MLAVTVGATAWAPWWTRASSTAAPTPPCKEDLRQAGAATQVADRRSVLRLVRNSGLELRHVSAEFRADRDVVLAAVKDQGGSLEHASQELRADKSVVMAAVKNYGGSLRYASSECRSDRALVLTSVKLGCRHVARARF